MVNVIAVDDNQDHLFILLKNLKEFGYNAQGFEDGDTAWEYMQAFPDYADVVMLDKMMPKMDGMKLVENMQAHPEIQHTIVIMQTADTRLGKCYEALENGVHFYLKKPFSQEKMYALLKAAVRIKKKQKHCNTSHDDDSFVSRLMH